MKADLINPFLNSSVQVIEALIGLKPVVGKLEIVDLPRQNEGLWLKIGIKGEMQNDILFGFPAASAMNIAGKMMGGHAAAELDEIGLSAVAELGNMIAGNAGAMLSVKGYTVDITTPGFVREMAAYRGQRAFRIPLVIEAVGPLHIHIVV